MKVLFVTNFPSRYRICFFEKLAHSVDLTVAYERSKALHRDPAWIGGGSHGFEEVYLELPPKGTSQSRGFGLVRFLRSRRFDRVVFSGYASTSVIWAVIYCARHGIKSYIEFDGGFDKNDGAFKRITKKFLLKRTAGCFVTCKFLTEYLKKLGVSENKIFFYPFTSVEKSEIAKAPATRDEKAKLKEKLGITEKTAIVSVGQFIRRKGYDVLLKSLDSVDRSVGVYIIGGEPTEEYKELCKKYSLGNVHFVGFTDKDRLFEWFKACDLFVLPTREDIWGLVINEAMACALPVISTDRCVAAVELVKNGVNGFVVPAEDAGALSGAINRALEGDLSAMGRESIAAVSEYTLENMAQRHVDVLCE